MVAAQRRTGIPLPKLFKRQADPTSQNQELPQPARASRNCRESGASCTKAVTSPPNSTPTSARWPSRPDRPHIRPARDNRRPAAPTHLTASPTHAGDHQRTHRRTAGRYSPNTPASTRRMPSPPAAQPPESGPGHNRRHPLHRRALPAPPSTPTQAPTTTESWARPTRPPPRTGPFPAHPPPPESKQSCLGAAQFPGATRSGGLAAALSGVPRKPEQSAGGIAQDHICVGLPANHGRTKPSSPLRAVIRAVAGETNQPQ